MHATVDQSSPDPTRSGAVWVTATGAFLLLAAAAVFTAVRWDQIPDAAKLAALVAATGGCLVAGRAMRHNLPASASALMHLGAFLVPVDVAALGMRADLDWPAMLLVHGVVATATFGLVARGLQSKILGWAFAAAVVVLAGGIGATTPLPAPLVLALMAAVAVAADRGRMAVAWALTSGLALYLVGADAAAVPNPAVLTELGLIAVPFLPAVAAALLSAVVIGIEGRRTEDTGIVLIGAAVGALGAVASWSTLELALGANLTALAATFLVIEIVTYRLRQDDFWHRPATVIARIAEAGAGIAAFLTPIALLVIALFGDETSPSAAIACAVTALGWFVVEVRSEGRGRVIATLGMAIAVVSVVGFATMSGTAVAISLVAVAATAVVLPLLGSGAVGSLRPGATGVAVSACWIAPGMAGGGASSLSLLIGATGAVVLTETAVRHFRPASGADARTAGAIEAWGWFMALSSVVPALLAVTRWAAQDRAPASVTILLVGTAAFGHLVGAFADRADTHSVPLGTVARAGAAAVLVGSLGLPAVMIGLVALAVAALSVFDAVRADEPLNALSAGLAIPVAVAAFGVAAGLSPAYAGVATTVSAAVVWGVGGNLGRRWLVPVAATVALALGIGLGLAASDQTALADALIVAGGLGMALAVPAGRLDGVLAGAAVSTVGIWLRLVQGGVEVSEPYLAPVAVILLLTGLRARSTGASSWIAYGPLVGLTGGSALFERMAGGTGWHAVVAGAVGVIAVAVGGHRHLSAPLFLGTALLVVLVGYETLAITRSLPTWTWLALGGATLLGAGVAMERRDMGPLETGRRLVDVITERYQ